MEIFLRLFFNAAAVAAAVVVAAATARWSPLPPSAPATSEKRKENKEY